MSLLDPFHGLAVPRRAPFWYLVSMWLGEMCVIE